MTAQVFQIAAESVAVTDLLGSPPGMRFFMFGEATQKTPRPYAVYQTVYGTPDNLLSDTPKSDLFGVQVDCYANSQDEARQVQQALRDAIEPVAYVVAWNGEFREPETRLYRCSFTVEFMSLRNEVE